MNDVKEKPVELKELIDMACMQFWIGGSTVEEGVASIEDSQQRATVKETVLKMHLVATVRIQHYTGLISEQQRDELLDFIRS